MLYLDHAATTPVRPAVAEAMAPFLGDRFGNSSGSHEVSRRAKNALEEARERAAFLIGARPQEIVFTGGGTESDNLALKGAALSGGTRGGVVTAATEHEAVLETVDFLSRFGCPTRIVGVDRHGLVDSDALAAAVTNETALVSVMAANNETGTVQPLGPLVAAVKAANPHTHFHTDAVQAFAALDIDVDDWGVDLLSLSAHKFGGPQGVGVLYVRSGVLLEPVLHGGGQELGRRSGTHNVAGAVGMGTAMELAVADRVRFRRDTAEARRRFEAKLSDRAERTVPEELTLPQHSHLRFGQINNETLLVLLDRVGVAASAGSACASGAATVSHVLEAMGLTPDEARRSLRFSFGWTSSIEDSEQAAELVLEALKGHT
ncbi:MAG TPA: cysteine desulfurase family protein [Acidimicrobiia bacterium]|nr:cysteine desulfurase family protein [Acidimicrobiia bacterium]